MSDDPSKAIQSAKSSADLQLATDTCRERYAVLSYRTDNLGDEIQSIAAEQFLPWIDLRIDRDRLDRRPQGTPDGCKIILNGWYTHAPHCWPPGPFLSPLITSFHISREVFRENAGGLSPALILLRGESLRYLRQHGPIGTRDLATLELLRAHRVDAQFSGCLTLTLGSGRAVGRGDYVCAVDLPDHLNSRMLERTRSRIVIRTHHCAGGGSVERSYVARRLLSLYARAKCVVTTRLHCALPCLALGTPVLFVPGARDSYRFEGLAALLHHCGAQEYFDGTFPFDVDNPPPNPDTFLPLRAGLIRDVARFCTGSLNIDGISPFPFEPAPISDSLWKSELVSAAQQTRVIESDGAFRRIFRSGRSYEGDHRADFLRDIGRVHGESGDRDEAVRLLRKALVERPKGTYIEKLLHDFGKPSAPVFRLTVSPTRPRREAISSIVAEVLAAKLTYLGADRLDSLLEELDRVKSREVAGDFVEFGVALGGSGICIAFQLDGTRRFWGFDGFGMIPPPTEADGITAIARYDKIVSGGSQGIGGDQYYGYVEDLYGTVVDNFARFGLRVDRHTLNLVPGVFQSTLPQQMDFPVAFAHIDCDWYEHVKYCLNFVHDRLSRFGIIIVDDYNDWPGCRAAVDEFCSKRVDVALIRTAPQAVLLKLVA